MENKSSSVESEYIKNLQQQVYFLELEANFLREQAKKATSLQPQVASEMERMRRKLQELQSQSDGLQLELKRKESHLNMRHIERERLSNQIHVADEHHSREKQALVEEIIQLKKQKLQKDKHISAKEMEILHAKQELEQQKMNLSNREQSILVLQAKVKHQSEQEKTMEMQLSEKREEFLKLQSNVHAMEDKVFKKTAALQEHITHKIGKEVSFLNQQIRQRELQAEQKRLLRSKMMDDYAALTKENATLQAQLLELSKQMDIISILENRNTSLDLSVATINSQVAKMRAILYEEEQNNLKLKRDKALLVDLISTLENKLAGKETSFLQVSTRMLQLDEAISAIKTKHMVHQSLETKKWEEISKMEDSIKKLNNQ